MRRSAAEQASAAADALLAWLGTQPSAGPAALDGAPPLPIRHNEAPGPTTGAADAAEPATPLYDGL